ncbi:hypothetical protein H2248_005170 [Termitomyces sp. 'cryptogamus']|nr:hypothetical protein H2248_005170 [Termitomyces sp. 'cryptogamus']
MTLIRTPVTIVLALAFAQVPLAAYTLQDAYKGHDFFDYWTWEIFADPTHGRVNYIDKSTAISGNLSTATFHKFFMRADSTSVVSPNARGRDSVRIHSNTAYGDSVIVLDVQHMPAGCGTWPAFWTNSQKGPWPHGGEIDVIEGVHLNTNNLASLHATPACIMPPARFQTGDVVSSDCNTQANSNQGCGTSFTKRNSYGAGFNNIGGGWYVLERSRHKGIKVWFWPRNDDSVPLEVKHDSRMVVPDSWSECEPDAYFPTGKQCDYDSHFDDHEIIFDLTFCGDWAGAVWGTSGCGSGTCQDFVDNNPENFKEAYWEINSLRVYTEPDFRVSADDE